MRQRRTVFSSLGLTADMNEGMYRGDSLNDFTSSIRCFLFQF